MKKFFVFVLGAAFMMNVCSCGNHSAAKLDNAADTLSYGIGVMQGSRLAEAKAMGVYPDLNELDINQYLKGIKEAAKTTDEQSSYYKGLNDGIQMKKSFDQMSEQFALDLDFNTFLVAYAQVLRGDTVLAIDKNLVNKKIEVRGHIIATKPLSPFKFPEHNKELLGEVPFNINPGEILAISDHFYNIPVDAYDPLADRPSIFSIRQQNDHPDEDISVDIFSDDKIRILLNRETYDKYRKLYEAPEVRTVLASMFVVPVLVDVLSYIKHAGVDELESVSTKKWYSVILSRLSALNIDLAAESSMTKVANIVLPNVFKTSVESFTQVFDALIPSGGANNED
jgi:hypothetical protein